MLLQHFAEYNTFKSMEKILCHLAVKNTKEIKQQTMKEMKNYKLKRKEFSKNEYRTSWLKGFIRVDKTWRGSVRRILTR